MAQSGGLRRWNTLLGNHFADLVLLCGFGPDLDRTRTHQELRVALRSAGYGGSLGRHLILTSPVLRRLRGNRFALVRFTERGATR